MIELINQKSDAYDEYFGIECGTLADYLLKNGVIVPPCKVGDTVYILQGGKILSAYVTEIYQDMYRQHI